MSICYPYVIPAAAAATYTGPGDIVSGATAWFGLRAYNAAYATGSNAAIDIVDSGGVNPATINILSTGALDQATLTTWIGLHGTASVTKLYDQSGNGKHVTQATVAFMPTITTSALGSFSALTCNLSNQPKLRGTLAGALTQPFSTSCVAERTGSFSGFFHSVITGNGNGQYFTNSAATVAAFAGTVTGVTAADSAPHALNATYNSASSALMVDGSDTTGIDSGTSAFGTTLSVCDNGSDTNFLTGFIFECGVWSGGFTGTQRTNLDTNQQTYWGF